MARELNIVRRESVQLGLVWDDEEKAYDRPKTEMRMTVFSQDIAGGSAYKKTSYWTNLVIGEPDSYENMGITLHRISDIDDAIRLLQSAREQIQDLRGA